MRTAEGILYLAVAFLTATLAAQLITGSDGNAGPVLIADWAESPASLEETAASAASVVRGRVTQIRQGNDIVTRVPEEPSGEDRIPVEVVTLRVDRSLKGPDGGGPPATVEVFHLGRSTGQDHIGTVEDPPYAQGEEYLLFLKAGPSVRAGGGLVPSQRVVSPQGRYRVRGGRIEPAARRGWAAAHRGKSVDQFEGDVQRGIQQAAGRRPGP